MANKIKNYFSGLVKKCNIIACVIVGLVMGALVFAFDHFGLIGSLKGNSTAFTVILIALIAMAGIVLAIEAIMGIKSKTINVVDSLLVIGLVGIILAIVYTVLTIESYLTVYKWIVVGIMGVIEIVVLGVRIANYDIAEETIRENLPSNVTVASYYKAFFKKFGIVAIIYALVAIAVVILIERLDFISLLLVGEYKVVAWGAVALCFILFLALYVSRLRDKEMGSVDVALFVIAVAGLALSIVEYIHGGNERVLVAVIADVVMLVSIVLSLLIVKFTHVYTGEEQKAYKKGKGSVKFYFNSLFAHTNILTIIAVSLFVSGLIVAVNSTGILTEIVNNLSIAPEVIVMAFIAVAVIVVAILAADIKLHRIETVDDLLITIALTSILTLVANYAILGANFVPGGLAFLILAVASIALIALRIVFVKEIPAETQEEKPLETVAEEVAVTEDAALVEPATEEALTEEVPTEKPKKVTVKKSYEMYLRTGDEQLKENYSALKNAFLSYGLHGRMTKSRENFSKKGITMSKVSPDKALRLQAKLLVRGKFLKLYINVDPTTIDEKYLRIKNVSEKTPDQATYIKIRSKLSLKRAIELVDILAEKEGFKKKKKFEEIDYTKDLSGEGLTYMQTLGYDYMVKESVSYAEVLRYKDDWVERIVKTKLVPEAERYIYDEITLEQISNAFKDGEVVNLEALRTKGLIKPNANYVTVKPSAHLTKKLFVEANVIDEKAIQMIAIAGGEATRLVFN